MVLPYNEERGLRKHNTHRTKLGGDGQRKIMGHLSQGLIRIDGRTRV